MSAVPAYRALYHEKPDPTAFVTPEMMSDEASCTEGQIPADEPAFTEWKTKMATHTYGALQPPEVLEKVKFFEIIRPNFHSELVTNVLHRLAKLHWEGLTQRQRSEYAPRVRGSGRASDNPPTVAPFNIAIDEDWFELVKNRDEYQTILMDYYAYGNPAGWDEVDIKQEENVRPAEIAAPVS
ncbi:hypothetical protein OF83DRAFT_1177669 [Amylostereum chailletii]|nr:hypothetical protein OF83DRAFT_1177669 [Amylostereum chailletii]